MSKKDCEQYTEECMACEKDPDTCKDEDELSETEVQLNDETQGNVYRKKKCAGCGKIVPTLMLDPEWVRCWCAVCLKTMSEILRRL